MPIRFRCDQCRNEVSVSSKLAGDAIQCPQCRETITVPIVLQKRTAVAAGGDPVRSGILSELGEDDEPANNRRGSRFTCPDCESTDTASYEMVYAAGTKTQSIQMVGVDGDGDLMIGGGGGRSMTTLAARVAPPTGKYAGGAQIATFAGFMGAVVFIAFGVAGPRSSDLPRSAMIILFLIFAAARYNNTVLPRRHAQWRQFWLCRRCGHSFIPGRQE